MDMACLGGRRVHKRQSAPQQDQGLVVVPTARGMSGVGLVRAIALFLLLLCAHRSGADPAFTGIRDRAQEIYVIDVRIGESSVRNLTNHFANDRLPDWSRDGSRIAFVSDRDNEPGDIFVMDGDGGSPTNLTVHPAWDRHSSWSPDGRQLAFTSNRSGNRDIFVMDSDGANLRRVTQDVRIDAEPAWSPDGAQIAFTSTRGGNYGIYLIGVDGSKVTELTNHPEGDGQPAWSPDGRLIAFASSRDGPAAELYVMTANGNRLRRLTERDGHSMDPN